MLLQKEKFVLVGTNNGAFITDVASGIQRISEVAGSITAVTYKADNNNYIAVALEVISFSENRVRLYSRYFQFRTAQF